MHNYQDLHNLLVTQKTKNKLWDLFISLSQTNHIHLKIDSKAL